MRDELSDIAERWRWGAPLAGAPDRSLTERWAAKAAIDYLAGEGWQLKSLDPPLQPHLSPDVVAELEDGRRIGIEVTEVRDRRSAKRAQAVKEGREAAHYYRDWDAASLPAKLRVDVSGKDRKRRTAISCRDGKRRAWGGPLDEYLVVVHTDELLISGRPSVADDVLKAMAPVELSHVTRAFFLIWYVPRSVGPRPRIYEIPVLSASGGAPGPGPRGYTPMNK